MICLTPMPRQKKNSEIIGVSFATVYKAKKKFNKKRTFRGEDGMEDWTKDEKKAF